MDFHRTQHTETEPTTLQLQLTTICHRTANSQIAIKELATEEEETSCNVANDCGEDEWIRYLLLRDVVLPRLPVRKIYQMRSVSKMFQGAPLQDIINSHSSSEERWFLMHKFPGRNRPRPVGSTAPWDFVAFSNVEKEFFQIPALRQDGPKNHQLGSLLHGSGYNYESGLKEEEYYMGAVLRNGKYYARSFIPSICSAGGLICACVNHMNDTKADVTGRTASSDWDFRVIVFDCLSGSVKMLPPGHNWGVIPNLYTAMTESYDNHNNYYILLSRLSPENQILPGRVSPECRVFSDDWFEYSFQVYDSLTNQWKITQPLALAKSDSTELLQCDFFTLHVELDKAPRHYLPGAIQVFGYRARTNQWFKTTIIIEDTELFQQPIRTNYFSDSAFVKYNGRLLMLFSSFRRGGNSAGWPDTRVLEVLPVTTESSTLVEISAMPKHLNYLSMGYRALPRPIAGANLFCISFLPTQLGALDDKHVVVYDIAKDHWYPIVLPQKESDMCYACFTVIDPRLNFNQTARGRYARK